MLIFLPVLFLLLAALTLWILGWLRRGFKYPWVIAFTGALGSLAVVLAWQLRFPSSVSLPPWQPFIVFTYKPTWLADGVSWPYALSLCTLLVAILMTSVVRAEKPQRPWIGTLLLTALGLLTVTAGDPLTLILVWTAIDLAELITILRSAAGGNRNREAILAWGIRITGTGFVIYASAIGSSTFSHLTFSRVSSDTGIHLLIACILRLSVLPLHLPFAGENHLRRGVGTNQRLISAASSLVLLARIPPGVLEASWTPYLLGFCALAALYSGWMWLRSSEEIVGRPFWILGMAALAIASTLRSNPLGSIGWGVGAILGGGLLFLFSTRQRSILWLPLLGLWGCSALPYSPSAFSWVSEGGTSWLFLAALIPAQAFLMAGYMRHTLHPGETSFESQERWPGFLYLTGLLLLVLTSVLLGVWGWDGARVIGLWPIAIGAILLAGGMLFLARRMPNWTNAVSAKWPGPFTWQPVSRFLTNAIQATEQTARFITSTLEGEGGIFWSILLLVLILALLAPGGR